MEIFAPYLPVSQFDYLALTILADANKFNAYEKPNGGVTSGAGGSSSNLYEDQLSKHSRHGGNKGIGDHDFGDRRKKLLLANLSGSNLINWARLARDVEEGAYQFGADT